MRPTVVTLVDAARKLLLACVAAATFVPDVAPAAESTLRVAVTTSFISSGAAARLTPAFEQQTGIRVKLVVVGSGAAFRMARVGEVDATVTHSPDDEKLIDDGLAAVVRKVMSNDMLIVGPAEDLAAARSDATGSPGPDRCSRSAVRLARGRPGHPPAELSLWKQAGIDPLGKSWYEEIGPACVRRCNMPTGVAMLVDRAPGSPGVHRFGSRQWLKATHERSATTSPSPLGRPVARPRLLRGRGSSGLAAPGRAS
jgi:ABC-type tungstate transport system permease subunit